MILQGSPSHWNAYSAHVPSESGLRISSHLSYTSFSFLFIITRRQEYGAPLVVNLLVASLSASRGTVLISDPAFSANTGWWKWHGMQSSGYLKTPKYSHKMPQDFSHKGWNIQRILPTDITKVVPPNDPDLVWCPVKNDWFIFISCSWHFLPSVTLYPGLKPYASLFFISCWVIKILCWS